MHFPRVESQLCFDVAAIYQRSSFPKASDVYREWLVYFPRVESQLCACLEPRLGRKLADAELVVLMQVSYDPGARRPFGLHLVVTNRLPARGWGLRQKRCLPFLLRGLSTSLSLRHSVSYLTCQVWNQLRIELPRSRTPLLAFVLTNGLAIAKLEKANVPTVVSQQAILSDYTSYRLDSIRAVWHARLANAGAIDALERKVCQGVKL